MLPRDLKKAISDAALDEAFREEIDSKNWWYPKETEENMILGINAESVFTSLNSNSGIASINCNTNAALCQL
jgi:hypothetical protein